MFQIKSVVFFLFFVNAFAREQTSGLLVVDYIFDSLSSQQWDDNEITCRDRILNILENVKNSTLWATWVWNSIDQSPTGIFMGARFHLGNYDQCLRPPWLVTHPELRTQYCLAEIEMNKGGLKTMEQVSDPYTRAEKYYIDTKTIIGRSFSYIAHGVCLPAGCPSKSTEKFVRALMSAGYLPAAKGAAVSVHHCEEAGDTHEYSNGFYVFIYTFASLFFVAIACTYYVNQFPATDPSLNCVAKSFCVRRNWETLVKESNTDLPCLDGIRVLSAVIIPAMHLIAVVTLTSASNGLDIEMMSMHHLKAYLIIHGDVVVDTFLALSGLLLGKNLTAIDITTPYSALEKILLRYLRLIGPLAVAVFYMAHVSMHTEDGPVYPRTALLEQQTCEKNWWLTLLMVGNYVNTLDMCLVGSWYVACDFQLYAMTIVLLFVYSKSPRVGKAAAVFVFVGGFLAPPITTYLYNLPGVVVYNVGLDFNSRSNSFFRHLYSQTHNRMGPYVAGLAVGYLMSIYKPKDYKKISSNKTTSFLGVCACLSLMLLVLAAGLWTFRYKVHGVLACVFATFDRTTFGIAVLGVVVFCTYGNVPLINSFLSWSAFTPFSRLSYGVYLIHQLLLYKSKLSLRSNARIQLFDLFTESLGVTAVSLALSLGVWLLIEAPLFNIITIYLRFSKKSNSGNGVYRDERNEQKLK